MGMPLAECTKCGLGFQPHTYKGEGCPVCDNEVIVKVRERRAKVMMILKDISPEARAEVEKAFDDFCRPAPQNENIDISVR